MARSYVSSRTDTDDDSPRQSSIMSIDDETEESLIAKRVDRLTSSLKDTGRNLRNVNGLLEDFRDRDNERQHSIDRLREDLKKSTEMLKLERQKSGENFDNKQRELLRHRSPSPNRNIRRSRSFDRQVTPDRAVYQTFSPPSPQPPPTVRFEDDDALASLQRSIAELNNTQRRMGNELASEIDARNKMVKDYQQGAHQPNVSYFQPTPPNIKCCCFHNKPLHQNSCHNPSGCQKVSKDNEEVDRINRLEEQLSSLQTELMQSKKVPPISSADISDSLRQEMTAPLQQFVSSPRTSLRRPVEDSEDERIMRRKLIRSESAMAELQSELESSYRRVEQAENARAETLRQMAEIRDKCTRSEEEKSQLKNKIDDYTAEIRREVANREDKFLNDRQTLEEEIRRLKSQLNDPRRNTDIEYYRSECERIEKQRDLANQQLQEMQKAVQDKDIAATEAMFKIKDLQNRLDESERVRKKALANLEDASHENTQLKFDKESLTEKCRNYEASLTSKEREKEELQNKARTYSNNCKVKIQRLQQELDKERASKDNSSEKMHSMERELDMLRMQQTTDVSAGPYMMLSKEIQELALVRADNEEMKRKSEEIKTLHAVKAELDSALKSALNKIESLEAKIEAAQEQHEALRQQVNQADLREQMARDEVRNLLEKIRKQEDTHTNVVQDLKRDIQQLVNAEQQNVQEMVRTMQTERSDFESEISHLKAEIEDNRNLIANLRDNNEKGQAECNHQHEVIKSKQSELERMEKKLIALQHEFNIRCNLYKEADLRIQKLENTICMAKERIKKQENELSTIMTSITMSIDGIITYISGNSRETYKALSPIRNVMTEPQAWLAEMTSKLKWIRAELDSMTRNEDIYALRQSRTRQRNVIHHTFNEDDILEEISRQKSIIDEMLNSHEDFKELTSPRSTSDINDRFHQSKSFYDSRCASSFKRRVRFGKAPERENENFEDIYLKAEREILS